MQMCPVSKTTEGNEGPHVEFQKLNKSLRMLPPVLVYSKLIKHVIQKC